MAGDDAERVFGGVLIDLNVRLSGVIPLPGGIVVQHQRGNGRRQRLLTMYQHTLHYLTLGDIILTWPKYESQGPHIKP